MYIHVHTCTYMYMYMYMYMYAICTSMYMYMYMYIYMYSIGTCVYMNNHVAVYSVLETIEKEKENRAYIIVHVQSLPPPSRNTNNIKKTTCLSTI